jgi:hypothetical protein
LLPNQHFDVGRCVFCGWEGTLTKEHAWPSWIREVLPAGRVKGHSQQHRVAATTGEVTAITPVLREKAANRKVQVVCQRECNGGWMSALENTAKPLLVPMILGETPHLSAEDRTTISFWVAKTAMMLQLIHPMTIRAIPAAHYRYVYEQRQAPQSMRVWLSAASDHFYRTAHYTRGYRLPSAFPPSLRPLRDEPIPPNAYTSVMVIGRLVMSLVGWTIPEGDFTVRPNDRWAPARRCVWPPRPTGWAWPPDVILSSLIDIEMFAAAATE